MKFHWNLQLETALLGFQEAVRLHDHRELRAARPGLSLHFLSCFAPSCVPMQRSTVPMKVLRS